MKKLKIVDFVSQQLFFYSSVELASEVVHNGVAFDVDSGGAVLHNDRRAVEVDAVVDDEQRVVVVDDIVVDGDAVQVLL